MNAVAKLLCLDATLKYLANERTEAANSDDVGKASAIDELWRLFDGQRQDVNARASDHELVAYELARHTC